MSRPRRGVEIIIKLREGGLLVPRAGGREFDADHLDLSELQQIVTDSPGTRLQRSFRLSPELQRKQHLYAEARLGRPIPSPNLFLRLQVPKGLDVHDLLRRVSAANGVGSASLATVPAPPPQIGDLTGDQGFLGQSPDGVDVHHAWSLPGGDGTGVKVSDCEYAFDPHHEDLDVDEVVTGLSALETMLPMVLPDYKHHGTAVLGVLGAKPNGTGVTGICHGAEIHFSSEATHLRTECISKALEKLGPGDVLLLEMQGCTKPLTATGGCPSPLVPAEADTDIYAQIQVAVGNKVTVVEAAANGSADLATLTNGANMHIWAEGSADDSLAIIVGAGRAPGMATDLAPAAMKVPASNYGARVDCQAWGGYVVTTGYGIPAAYDGGLHKEYMNGFGGTSSAAAIVAGAIACLQGAAKQALGEPLTPEKVRELFRNDGLGLPCKGSDAIGPLPDLYRIMREAGILARIRLRDSLDRYDLGSFRIPRGIEVPRMCRCPDLIVRRQRSRDAVGQFGLDGWSDPDLCEEIRPGAHHYVYVRAENQGTVSDHARVTVYWATPGTYLHPRSWKRVGSADLGEVGPGGRVVAGPILWRADRLPPEGRCVLIGVVRAARDRDRVPRASSRDARYLAWLQETESVAFRAIHEAQVPLGGASEPFPIALHGRSDTDARCRLVCFHDLPPGSTVTLKSSRPLTGSDRAAAALGRPLRTEYEIGAERRLVLEDVHLPRNGLVRVNVTAHVPSAPVGSRHPFVMAHYSGRRHLGTAHVQFEVV